MAQAIPHPCAESGCPRLVTTARCPEHTGQTRQRYDQQRGSAAARGYDRRWEKFRIWFLRRHPVCEIRTHCNGDGASEVDHKVPLVDGGARLDEANCQGACKPCHSAKTARENRGFGRPGTHQGEGG